MLIIRLQRTGRRNLAEFRVVLTEHKRSAKTGNVLSVLGNYNPHTNTVTVDAEAVKGWIAKGAQVSDTVHKLFISEGIIEGKKRNVLPKKTVPAKEETPTEEAEPKTTEASEAPATAPDDTPTESTEPTPAQEEATPAQ